MGTRWQNGWCIGCSFLSSEQQVRILPDPFAPEVIAEEHLSDQEAMVQIHLGAFANPIRGGVMEVSNANPTPLFVFPRVSIVTRSL